jgi:hypothetical protein
MEIIVEEREEIYSNGKNILTRFSPRNARVR